MAKAKITLFSLGASGTLGDTLTLQKRGGTHYARKKPTPTDPRSLLQIIRRHNYHEASEWWNTLTPTEKYAYHSLTVGKPLTEFNAFMRQELDKIPDFLLYCPFNEGSGVSIADFSNYHNNGTIFGASWGSTIIGPCLDFDGIDDYALFPHKPQLNLPVPFTIELWFNPREVQDGSEHYAIGKSGQYIMCYDLGVPAFVGSLAFLDTDTIWRKIGPIAISHNTLHLWTGVYDPPNMTVMLDGAVAKTEAIGTFTPITTANPLLLAKALPAGPATDCLIDEPRILAYAMTLAEHQMHYERGV